MKILIFSDNHWSQYSSIVRSRGTKYSTRLEKSIETMNWLESLAIEKDCDMEVCCGDFFDKAELGAEELTALQDIKWNTKSHIFIVGNHELGINSLQYSSAHLFSLIPNAEVIDKPTYLTEDIFLLPYILESKRESLVKYLDNRTPRIILSHNDIAGIQMGKFISQDGFSIKEIENNCQLYINGHLHNGEKISDKIINIGNIIGQNFNEDATKYDHCAFILDTETLKIEVYRNPYSFNFYKLDLTQNNNFDSIQLENNAVCTIKCLSEDTSKVKEWITNNNKIIESRIIVDLSRSDSSNEFDAESLSVDHLEKFRQYILDNLGSSDLVISEINEVVK